MKKGLFYEIGPWSKQGSHVGDVIITILLIQSEKKITNGDEFDWNHDFYIVNIIKSYLT